MLEAYLTDEMKFGPEIKSQCHAQLLVALEVMSRRPASMELLSLQVLTTLASTVVLAD